MGRQGLPAHADRSVPLATHDLANASLRLGTYQGLPTEALSKAIFVQSFPDLLWMDEIRHRLRHPVSDDSPGKIPTSPGYWFPMVCKWYRIQPIGISRDATTSKVWGLRYTKIQDTDQTLGRCPGTLWFSPNLPEFP